MKNYLIIDYDPPASRALRLALMESSENISINQTHDPKEIKTQLASDEITVVFVRVELWDYRLFEEAIRLGRMPELVLLGKLGQGPLTCCGFGVPYFLTEDLNREHLLNALNFAFSPFSGRMNFRFVLVNDEDRLIKIDIEAIDRFDERPDGVILYTRCGTYILHQPIRDFEKVLISAGFDVWR